MPPFGLLFFGFDAIYTKLICRGIFGQYVLYSFHDSYSPNFWMVFLLWNLVVHGILAHGFLIPIKELRL
jgi:hypothetical protein